MDEWMLNDLLECSVCLERLDTSSKVLPCQHTFCKKCLEEIVSTHKELRCPECRVLVDIKIDDLPPNVLLMRILEGMRNAAPKKRNSGGPPANRHPQLYQHHHQQQQPPQHQQPPQQQQQHLHQLATSVSSSQGSGSNPLLAHLPRFCYNPHQRLIMMPQMGKSEANLNFPAHATTTLNQPPTFSFNPNLSSTNLNPHYPPTISFNPNLPSGVPATVSPNPTTPAIIRFNTNLSSAVPGSTISNPNHTTTVINPNFSATGQPSTISLNPNLFSTVPVTTSNPNHSSTAVNPTTTTSGSTTGQSIPTTSTPNSSTKNDPKPVQRSSNNQHQLFYSFPQARLVGESTATQIVKVNTISSSAGGVCLPRHGASVVSTHTSNCLSNGGLTQTCPHSYPGFGSISSVGIVPPRTQHNPISNATNPGSVTVAGISNATGQQRLSYNTVLTSTQSPTNPPQNYLLLSNSRSSPSLGPANSQISYAEASGSSNNQTHSSSKVTSVFSLNKQQVGLSSAANTSTNTSQATVTSTGNLSTVRNVTSMGNVSSTGNVSTISTIRNVTSMGNASSTGDVPSIRNMTSMGDDTSLNNQQSSSQANMTQSSATSTTVSIINQPSSGTNQSVPNTEKRAENKDRSRPNSVYQYSQLADCISLTTSMPPTNQDRKEDEDTNNLAPPPQPPVRSESIDCDSSAEQSSVGNTAVKSVGSTESTAANHQSVPLIKGINQPCARAVYDYLSKMPGDLSFKEGDLIILRRKIDNNWYHGECRGQSGVFPLSYVQILTPLPNHIPQCKALFDFRMNNDDEEGCLTFNKGDVVTVIRRVDENWAEGRLGERIGIFPLAFVELNNVARALMKLSINSQPGPSRVAPPTPTVDSDATPLIPTDHSGTTTTTVTTLVTTTSTTSTTTTPHALASDGSTSTTLTSPSSSSTSSTSSSSSSTSPPTSSSASSPSSPPPPPSQSAAKRHSFNALQQQQQPNQHSQHNLQPPDHHSQQHNNRHSAEILTSNEVSSTSGPHSLAVMTSGSNTSSCNTPTHTESLLTRSASQRRHHQRSASADAHHTSHVTPHHTSHVTPHVSLLLPASADGHGTPHHTSHVTSHHVTPHVSLLLPATYVALYPYKPQKSDELELKRGNVYTVTERCQDGWFKGTNKHQKCGVFPGNYVAPSKSLPAVQAQLRGIGRIAIVGGASGRVGAGAATNAPPSPEPRAAHLRQANARLLTAPGYGNVVGGGSSNPPELPPRSVSPGNTISSSWHSGDAATHTPTRPHNMSASVGSSHHDNSNSVGRNSPTTVTTSPPNVTVTASKSSEKVKEKKERTSGGGIMRIFSMKKSPPPPPATYSMDNPVFEDGGTIAHAPTPPTTTHHSPSVQQLTPVHVRSGSCPSQLLQVTPSTNERSSPSHHHHQHHHHRLFSPSSSQRLKHKERPTVNGAHFASPRSSGGESSFQTPPPQHHRKSNSLDASATLGGGSGGGGGGGGSSTTKQQLAGSKQLVPVVRERFRCIVPYPPNSDYELELQVGDVIYVHRKRDDGWYKGTQQRTGKTGLFPASFVESF